MTDFPLIPGQHIHIIGVGGFGMSAIARVLHENGFTVTGSDRAMSDLALALQADGVRVFEGHAAQNTTGAELVLMSSAVPEDNPEVVAARAAHIPVLERRDFIATLTAHRQTIAIAGTHGKTTTTAMLSHVLREAGLEPSYIVGGILGNTGTNAGAGDGDYFIIEADEYGYMFLGLDPQIAVVTNVEYDHPDFFASPDDLLLAFRLFVEQLRPDGTLFACMNDDVALAIADERRAALMPVQTYSVGNNAADWWASDLTAEKGGMRFTVHRGAQMAGGAIGELWIPLPGEHNVQNAMAVIAIASDIGVPFRVIAAALKDFAGTGRRSELMGQAGGVRVINDYAHHPTAIRATLKAWQEQLSEGGRLWAVWQPHTYSRTRALAESFAAAFSFADHALVTDIYAAREDATPGLFAKDLAQMIRANHHPDARHSGDIFSTAQVLADEVRSGDVVVLMTAGDAPQIGRALLDVLQKREGA